MEEFVPDGDRFFFAPVLEKRSDGRSGVKKGGRIRYSDGALGKAMEQGGRCRSPDGPARVYGCDGATVPGLEGPAQGRLLPGRGWPGLVLVNNAGGGDFLHRFF